MQCALSAKVSVAGKQVSAAQPRQRVQSARLVVRAADSAASPSGAMDAAWTPPAKEAPAEPKAWSPPALDASTPSPIFGGSTGGLLRKAQVEEFHVITWEAKKEQIFEMPTGGAAIMRQGPNLLKLSRKEQCLALLTQLRTKFKTDGFVYRVFPNGEVQYLHPKDGVYPEKVNAGRTGDNTNMRRIGQNSEPVQIKFSGKIPAEF